MNRKIDFYISSLVTVLALSACGGPSPSPTPPSATPAVSYHTLAAGGASNCRVNGDTGALACWGQNDMGQLGIGSASASVATPASVNLGVGKTAKQVVVGIDHACAILNDDTVSCWGNNSAGQLGQATTTASSNAPLTVPGITAKALTLGFEHTCAITLTDTVRCWGSNSKGQLGQTLGNPVQSHTPQAAVAGLTAKNIKSGFSHVCAIASDDTVQCWGDNQYGQLGNTSNVDSSTAVVASGLSGVKQLAAGAYHTCAATAAAISCWGRNDASQLGSSGITDMNVPTQTGTVRANVIQLVAGLSHTCAMSSTTVECWGSNVSKQLSGTSAGGVNFATVAPLTAPKNVSSGLNHSCAQDSGNKTYCWGAGSLGRLGSNAATDSATLVLVP